MKVHYMIIHVQGADDQIILLFHNGNSIIVNMIKVKPQICLVLCRIAQLPQMQNFVLFLPFCVLDHSYLLLFLSLAIFYINNILTWIGILLFKGINDFLIFL